MGQESLRQGTLEPWLSRACVKDRQGLAKGARHILKHISASFQMRCITGTGCVTWPFKKWHVPKSLPSEMGSSVRFFGEW